MFFQTRRKRKQVSKVEIENSPIFIETEIDLRNKMKLADAGDTLIFLKGITLSEDFVVDKDVVFKLKEKGMAINTAGHELIFKGFCKIYYGE